MNFMQSAPAGAPLNAGPDADAPPQPQARPPPPHPDSEGDSGDIERTRRAANGYKRASRKNAPKRFRCEHEGCASAYTRAEHLRRHQRNHNPQDQLRCDEPGCNHKSVRIDLLVRHKERHAKKRTDRQEAGTPAASQDDPISPVVTLTSPLPSDPVSSFPTGLRDAAVLLTPESVPTPNVPTSKHHASWPGPAATSHHQPQHPQPRHPQPHPQHQQPQHQHPQPQHHPSHPHHAPPQELTPANSRRPSNAGFMGTTTTAPPVGLVGFSSGQVSPVARPIGPGGNFSDWLFEPQANFRVFTMSDSVPLLDFSFEPAPNAYAPVGRENMPGPSAFNATAQAHAHERDAITDARRQEVLAWHGQFITLSRSSEQNQVSGRDGDSSQLDLNCMRACLHEFWENVSPRLPIVHRSTFSANDCSINLLLIMLALGGASRRSRDTSAPMVKCGRFADVLASELRWQMMPMVTSPADLSTLQTLLLLEFYETMYSTSNLQERASVYHSTIMTLLRRSVPLMTAPQRQPPPIDARDTPAWWAAWVKTESLHRVVFVAFMLDIVHGAIFGRQALLSPDEIGLPLPCVDALWTAPTAEQASSTETSLRIYGLQDSGFQQSLKRAMEGEDVKTHTFGHMIIMTGLLSVVLQMKRNQDQLDWLFPGLDSGVDQDRWERILNAFECWKVNAERDPTGETEPKGISNGPVRSPTALYHLAAMSAHGNFSDCEIFAGTERIMGREVTELDLAHGESRFVAWTRMPAAGATVLRSIELLHRILGEAPVHSHHHNHRQQRGSIGGADASPPVQYHPYSVRREMDHHRPFIMYLAALTVWAFARAVGQLPSQRQSQPQSQSQQRSYQHDQAVGPAAYAEVMAYLSTMVLHGEASLGSVGEKARELVALVGGLLSESGIEALGERGARLLSCWEMS